MGIQEGPIEAAVDHATDDQPLLQQDEHNRKQGSGTAAENCCIENKEGGLKQSGGVSEMEKEDHNGSGDSYPVDKIESGAEEDESKRGDRLVEDAAGDRGQGSVGIESKPVEDSLEVDAAESASVEEPGNSSQIEEESEGRPAVVASEERNAAENTEARLVTEEEPRSVETGIDSVIDNGAVDQEVNETVDVVDPVQVNAEEPTPTETVTEPSVEPVEQEAVNENKDQAMELESGYTTGAHAEVDAGDQEMLDNQASGLASEDTGEIQAGFAEEVSVSPSSDAAKDKPSADETKQDDLDGRETQQAEAELVESVVVEATIVQEVEIEYVSEGKFLETEDVEDGTAALYVADKAEVVTSEATLLEVEVQTIQIEEHQVSVESVKNTVAVEQKVTEEVGPLEADTNEAVVKCERELERDAGGVETEEPTTTREAELSAELGEKLEKEEAVFEEVENDQQQETESSDTAQVESPVAEIRGLSDNQESSSSEATLSSVKDKGEDKLETEKSVHDVNEEAAPIQAENAGGQEVSDVHESKPSAEDEEKAKADDNSDSRDTQQDPGIVVKHVDSPEVVAEPEDKVVEAKIDHVEDEITTPITAGGDNTPGSEAVVSEATPAPEVDTKSVQVEDAAADDGEAQVESIAEVVEDHRDGNSSNEAEDKQSSEAPAAAEELVQQVSAEVAPKEAEISPSKAEDTVESGSSSAEATREGAAKVDDAQPEQESVEVVPREAEIIPSEAEDDDESSVEATKEIGEAGHSAAARFQDAEVEEAKEAESNPPEVEDAVVEAAKESEEAEHSAPKVDDAHLEQESVEVAPKEAEVNPSEVQNAVESSVEATKEAEEAKFSAAATKVDDGQLEQEPVVIAPRDAEINPSKDEDVAESSAEPTPKQAEEAEDSAATKVDDRQLEQESVDVVPKEAEVNPSEVQIAAESSVEATKEAEEAEHSAAATKVDDGQLEQEPVVIAPRDAEINPSNDEDVAESGAEPTQKQAEEAEHSAATKSDDGQLEQESAEVTPKEAEIIPSKDEDAAESSAEATEKQIEEAEHSAATKSDDGQLEQESAEAEIIPSKDEDAAESSAETTQKQAEEAEHSAATKVDDGQLEQESAEIAPNEAEIIPSKDEDAAEPSAEATQEQAEEAEHSAATKVDDRQLEQEAEIIPSKVEDVESSAEAPKEAAISAATKVDDGQLEQQSPKEAEITPSEVEDAVDSSVEATKEAEVEAERSAARQLEPESVEVAPKEAEMTPSEVEDAVEPSAKAEEAEEVEHLAATKVDDAPLEQEAVEAAPKGEEITPSEGQATEEASTATVESGSDIVVNEATETENVDPDGSEGALGETQSSKQNDAEGKANANAEDLMTSTDVPEVADEKEVDIETSNTALDNEAASKESEVEASKGTVEAESKNEEKDGVEAGDAAASEGPIGTLEDPASEDVEGPVDEQEKATEEHVEPASENQTEESTSGDNNVDDGSVPPSDQVTDADSAPKTIGVQAEEPANEDTAGPTGEVVIPASGDKSEDRLESTTGDKVESVPTPGDNVTGTSEAEAKVDETPSEKSTFSKAEAKTEEALVTEEPELPEDDTKSIQVEDAKESGEETVITEDAELPKDASKPIHVEDAKESAEGGSVTPDDNSTETIEAGAAASDKPSINVEAAIAEDRGLAGDAEGTKENLEGEQNVGASTNVKTENEPAVSTEPEQHDDGNGEEGTSDKSLDVEPLERNEEQKVSSVEKDNAPANGGDAKNDEVTESQADVEELKEEVAGESDAQQAPENVLEQGGATSDETSVEKNDVNLEQDKENPQEHEASNGAEQEHDLVVPAEKQVQNEALGDTTELTDDVEAEEAATEKVETEEHATQVEARELELPNGAEKPTAETAVENAETSEGEQPDFQDAVEFEDEAPSSDETVTLTNGPTATSKDGGFRTTVRSLVAAAMSLGKAKPSKKKRLRLKKELEKQVLEQAA